MAIINILSEHTANKIAAGEVIERPASVVKELVENAIDAGADRISIEITDGGKKLIRVTDNGCGMEQEDAQLCFKRFATSKIRTETDLEHLTTLGFRGEALPSIAAVSHFTLTTRAQDNDTATQITIAGGNTVEEIPASSPQGTCMEVKKLFFNVPARKKFMRTTQTETNAVTTLVTTYALTRPDITFKYTSNKKEILFSQASPNIRTKIMDIFGREVEQSLVEVKAESDLLKIKGFVVHPRFTRQNRSWQYFFVNQRPVSCSAFSFSLSQAFHTMVFRDRFPVCFLWLDIAPETIDVNIHPTKKEIKLAQEREIRRLLTLAIAEALEREKIIDKAPEEQPFMRESGAFYSRTTARRAYVPIHDPEQQTTEPKQSFFDEVSNKTGQVYEEQKTDTPNQNTYELSADLTIIGQFDNTYILAQNRGSLLVFDQHAAHERILFEELLTAVQSGPVESQRMLTPAIIDLAPAQFGAIEEHRDKLLNLGIDLIPYGSTSISIEALPVIFDSVNPIELINDLADTLSQSGQPEYKDIRQVEERMAMAACKAAVKAKDKLADSEMHRLITRLENCKNPHTCPHGRPTCIRIENSELEKRFKRKE